jgi:hypothetical protein
LTARFDREPRVGIGDDRHLAVRTATAGMWVRGTFCFRKLDGTWLIAHDQASVPFDVATGQAVTGLEP